MKEGLQIYTLGGERILRDGKPVTGFGTRKAEALLIYLAFTRRPHPREALADLLWDERSQRQALGNLRVALTGLRQQLGEYVRITREEVGLNPELPVWLDTLELEDCLLSVQKNGGIQSEDSASRLGEAITRLYRGEFLEGFTPPDCRQFEDWASRERERLHYLVVDHLKDLVAFELESGSYASGLEHVSRLLALDPLMEDAHRQRMLLLAYTGQRSGALEQYEACRKVLAEELQVEPSPETTSLYESIRDGTLETGKWAVPAAVKESPAPGLCPYKGLQYFDEADAPLFFGRETLVANLSGHLLTSAPPGASLPSGQGPYSHFLAVLGASGSGKSSAVRAGLVPAIRGATNWPVKVITPTAHPMQALSAVPHLFFEPGTGSGSLLVVDQFEELFSLCREEAERKAFIDTLLRLVEDGRPERPRLVIALRADFYAACAPYENLRQALAQRQEYIGPMSAEELRRSIEEPARLGKWDLEAGLVELFLRDIGASVEGQEPEPGGLPLLSHALMETWLRRQGRTLTLAGYAEAGGVRGAVARTAESVYAQLSAQEQSTARAIFLRLTELGEGTQETRRRATLAELVPPDEPAIPTAGTDARQVLNILADARLVTTTAGTAEVAHEALIREWGRLQEWLNEDREGLHLHRRLTEAAQEWERLRRDPGTLYRGSRLAQAIEWEGEHGSALNTLEKEFLQASQAESEREAAEREAQRQRELEAAQRLAEAERQRAIEQRGAARRLRRRAVYLSLSLAAALVMVLVAVLFARQAGQNLDAAQAASTQAIAQESIAKAASTEALAQRSTAEAASIQAVSEARTRATAEAVAVQEKDTAQQQTRLATSRELAAAALNNLEVDQDRSLLLAMQAVKTADIPEAENALHQAVLTSRLRDTLAAHQKAVYGVAFAPGDSPGAVHFATASEDGTVKVWKLDGTSLKANKTAILTISNPVDFRVSTDASGYSVAFSPNGSKLAAIGEKQTVKIWDASNGTLLHILAGHSGNVTGLAFSPDGERLASTSYDGTVKIWDVLTGQELQSLTGHASDGTILPAFSPDGKLLASSDVAGKVIIWYRNQGSGALAGKNQFTRSFSIESQFDFVTAIAFSPDMKQLAIGFNDIKIYDITAASASSPPRLLLHINPHGTAINGLYYTPDGKRLISGSINGTAKVWDAGTGQELFSLAGNAGTITSIALSKDGEHLLAAYLSGSVKVWDLSEKGNQEWLTIPKLTIGFSGRKGDRLLVENGDPDAPKVQVLDISSGEALVISSVSLEVSGRLGTIFDADQELTRLVALYPKDYIIHVWDLANGQELRSFSIEKMGDQAGYTSNELFAFKLSPDGSRLATGGPDGTVIVWDVQTGKPLRALAGQTDQFWGWKPLDFSPDGNRIASANIDGTLLIWDVESGSLLYKLTGHEGPYPNVSFSPDGKRLLATGEGTSINLWDVQTGKLLFTLPGSPTLVNNLAISPDNRYLAASHLDETVQIWDANTGQELLNLPGIFMSFIGESKHLITFKKGVEQESNGSGYGLILDINELMSLARLRLTRSWTPEECSKFLHNEACPSTP